MSHQFTAELVDYTHPLSGWTYSMLEFQFDNAFGMTGDSLGRIFSSTDIPAMVYAHFFDRMEKILVEIAPLCSDYDPVG
jgi:hypothetical protein